ncbi:WXG100 family type VII secretion target [Leifsonia sp. AK011]|uniref:WXG100 family type VII secretion target n=1 Tax=Leifsonia sp. AK011 TaxID=2723075 RepID=UPI0015CA9122|nr:WXG100 family type VII secretion target [Leifsonia sp. AK011]NYF11325.1 WXG100 family type VII secretion target [Leifsonia sp. AK011]
MSNINVSYDSINNAAGRLEQGRDDLTTKMQELNTLINQLVGDGFVTSQASGAYQAAFENYSNGAKQTIEGLTGLSNFLRKTAQTLQETDQAIASSIQ